MTSRVFTKLRHPETLGRSPILIFAADPMAAGGLHGMGRLSGPGTPYRTRSDFLELLRGVVADDVVDGLLMTPADAEVLAVDERLFEHSAITPIVRTNAETNIWNPRHGTYRDTYSRPFQTVPVSSAAYCADAVQRAGACRVHLGLYSITLNNDVAHDQETLNAYLRFAREVAEHPQFEHLLEVFMPNVNLPGMDENDRAEYVADSIVRTMSYLRRGERPQLIKTQFTNPDVWARLCEFDPTLVIGALGGPRTNARGSLELAWNVTEYGGRAILFGRAIFEEVDPRRFIVALREVLDRASTIDEALDRYQAHLRSR